MRRRVPGCTRRSSGSQGSWRSPSAVGSGLNLAAEPLPGERRLEQSRLANGTPVLGLSLGVRWETEDGQSRDFVIRAAQSLVPWHRELLRVRTGLATGFLLLALLLLGGLAVALRFALEPLRRLEGEIVDIEAGRRESLGTGWPRELAGVTGNLNVAAARRAQAPRALPHDARQPRAQPQDAARGDARARGAQGDGPGRARRRSSSACRPSCSTS